MIETIVTNHPQQQAADGDLAVTLEKPAAAPAQPVNLALFDSIQVQAQVVLGQVSLNVGKLMHMTPGELVATDRLVNQPVDLVVNGIVVARGELVAVEEHFGVRITELAQSGAV